MTRPRATHPAADHLRDLQTERGWTNGEVAARLGICESYWERLKHGWHWPSSKVIERIGTLLAEEGLT